MTITSEQAKVARRLLGWSQNSLGLKAGVSETTVRRFEGRKQVPLAAHLAAIKKVLEGAGIEFTEVSVSFRNEKAGP